MKKIIFITIMILCVPLIASAGSYTNFSFGISSGGGGCGSRGYNSMHYSTYYSSYDMHRGGGNRGYSRGYDKGYNNRNYYRGGSHRHNYRRTDKMYRPYPSHRSRGRKYGNH